MGHPVVRLAVSKRIGSEALVLVPIPLVLDDERPSLLDVFQKSRPVFAQLFSDQIGVGTDDHRVKAIEIEVAHLCIGDQVKGDPEGFQRF